jgi:hypothetical protein
MLRTCLISFFFAAAWAESIGPKQAPAAPAQSLQSKQLDLAQQEVKRMQDLVQAGALPRVRLEEAEQNVADAQDDVILGRLLYGDLPVQNLTEQMSDDMVAAAQRRVERQVAKLDRTKKLVADGILAQSALQPLQEELNVRQMNLNLAHTRAKLIGELASIAKYEESMQAIQNATKLNFRDFAGGGMQHYEGNGIFMEGKDLRPLQVAFVRKFERPLPISADGETALHRSLGFDHRGRVDVAVSPDNPEGIWLRRYLEARRIPYYAFRRAIAGKATAAHIHIGPGSTRLHNISD